MNRTAPDLDGRVFVSIASYRDPELVPTVRDCLAKARHPERLRFGICWQHGAEETLPDLFDGANFSVIDIAWERSRGACWARAALMDLWQGEEWYLQLDSHHRFVPDWDLQLLEQANRTGSAKPVISAYAAPYTPGADERVADYATRMTLHFNENGELMTGAEIVQPRDSCDPIRARFVSAHFLLAPGRFVEDIPYDPELYFSGEETMLTLRAFTHGYDLFHPGVPLIAHEYTRSYRTRHWDDHRRDRGMPVDWSERHAAARAKVSRFLDEPFVGYYGLGSERTFADYETYAGLSFARREIDEQAAATLEPPPPRVRFQSDSVFSAFL